MVGSQSSSHYTLYRELSAITFLRKNLIARTINGLPGQGKAVSLLSITTDSLCKKTTESGLALSLPAYGKHWWQCGRVAM